MIYDLSGTIEEGMWWYGEPYEPYRRTVTATKGSNGYVASVMTITAHMGSHVETISHWDEALEGVDKISLDKFCGEALVIDVPVNDQPGYKIEKDELVELAAGRIKPGDIVLLATGWDSHWDKDDWLTAWPYLSNDAGKWLVEQGVKAVGMDSAMISDPSDGMDSVDPDKEMVDKLKMMEGITLFLALRNLKGLPERVQFYGLPLKIRDCEGSPVRAIAVAD